MASPQNHYTQGMSASLTLIAIKTRKAIRYGLIAFFLIVVGRILLIFAIDTYKALVPPPPAPPTVGFGRLAEIPFPEQNATLPQLEFVINTPSGNLPTFPDQIPVYLMPLKTATLYSYDRIKQIASAFGFTNEPLRESETLYTFNHPSVPATFKADIVFETFSLSFNLAADSRPLNRRAPDVQTATNLVTQVLSRASAKPEDLAGPITSEFLRVEGQNLVRALSLSDAQLTRINLSRKPIVIKEIEYPSVTANPKEGNVWFIVSGSEEKGKDLIAGEYRYFAVDAKKFETYPLKTAQQALEDLKSGKGYIANLGLNTDGRITIREIYLGYYDPNTPYSFYQPVVVFKGDREFVAYVPAVTNEFYNAKVQ